MKPFAYTQPRSAENAIAALEEDGTLLAGGNDLLGRLKEGITAPKVVVSLARVLPGLSAIETIDGGWRIGAGATVAAIAGHAGLRQAFPGLTDAAAEVGSPQIRNVATLGGNLAQHSRCWYFRHPEVPCLKKGGSTCFAHDGRNKFHSLFSGNPCISPVVSNLATALTALEATVIVRRGRETVRLSLPQFYAAAWVNPLAHHSLEANDLITAVEIPAARNASAYVQVSEKAEFDWALVSCAASGIKRGGEVTAARVVLGCVAPVPWRKDAVDRLLASAALTPDLAGRAAGLLLEGAQPRAENGYKVPLAQTLVQRALLALLA